jgi:hypothetical protein
MTELVGWLSERADLAERARELRELRDCESLGK